MTSSRIVLTVVAAGLTAAMAGLSGSNDANLALAVGLMAPFLVPALWTATWLIGRWDPKILGGAALTAIAVFMVSDLPVSGVMVGYMVAGLVGAWALGRRWRVLPLLATVGACLVPGFFLDLQDSSVTVVMAELFSEMSSEYKSTLPEGLSVAERDAALTAFNDTAEQFLAMHRQTWPALTAMGFMVQAALFLGLGWGLARLRMAAVPLPSVRSLATWRAPFASVWVLIGGLILSLLGQGWMTTVGWSLTLGAASLLAIQGLVIQAWLVRMALPPLGQTIFWVLGAFFLAPMMIGGGALIGLADQWLDIRNRHRSVSGDN